MRKSSKAFSALKTLNQVVPRTWPFVNIDVDQIDLIHVFDQFPLHGTPWHTQSPRTRRSRSEELPTPPRVVAAIAPQPNSSAGQRGDVNQRQRGHQPEWNDLHAVELIERTAKLAREIDKSQSRSLLRPFVQAECPPGWVRRIEQMFQESVPRPSHCAAAACRDRSRHKSPGRNPRGDCTTKGTSENFEAHKTVRGEIFPLRHAQRIARPNVSSPSAKLSIGPNWWPVKFAMSANSPGANWPAVTRPRTPVRRVRRTSTTNVPPRRTH